MFFVLFCAFRQTLAPNKFSKLLENNHASKKNIMDSNKKNIELFQ